jgi:chemotaxis protein histidine kinase CheA/CheY-like chemotaxis protein
MDDRLLAIFRGEAGERLDEMVRTLLAVEAGEGDEESIRELFRHAHSLKGTAGMVGLGAIGTVAGAVEDLLAHARSTGELDPALAGPLLEVTDAIRAAMDGAPLDAEAVISRLRSADEGVAGRSAAASAPAQPEPETDPADPPDPDPMPLAATVDPPPAPAPVRGLPRTRTLRVAADRVDELLDVAGQAVVRMRLFEHMVGPQVDQRVRDELETGEALMATLQEAALRLRTLPLSSIVGPFPRAVRDIAVREGKEAELELVGVDAQLDRVILDGLSDLIVHLLRNAVSHGIEPPDVRAAAGKPPQGRIVLRADASGRGVTLSVSDDGGGIPRELTERASTPAELADLLATPGFSTAAEVGDLSGRGVGLDAVRRDTEALGGSLMAESDPGRGSTFTLLVPATLAVLGLLLVERAGLIFGLPLLALAEVVEAEGIVSLGDRVAVDVRGEAIQLADLADLLSMPPTTPPATGPVLIVAVAGGRLAVRVDRLVGEQEAVVKPLGAVLANVPGYLGATLLNDGAIGLIVDPRYLVRIAPTMPAAPPRLALTAGDPGPGGGGRAADEGPPTVLVVDDQHTVRELQRTILTGAGYVVLTARDGREALDLLEREPGVRLVLTDVEMPVLDGFGLLLALRDDPRFGALPVVIVSSRGSEDDRRRGAEAGADAYVDKGEFDQRTLLEIVERLVIR